MGKNSIADQFTRLNASALIFDGYGTLFDIHSVIPECERAFPGRGTQLSKKWRERQLALTRRCVLTRHYVDLWTLVERTLADTCRELNLDAPPELQTHLREQYLALNVFPEVFGVLPHLREKYRLAILSHGTQPMLDALVDRHALRASFDAVLSVDTVRAYKPDGRAYEFARQTLNLPREEIAYVGVNPFDIAGAKGFGMRTIWLRRVEPASRLMDLLCDAQTTTLEDLS